MTCGRLLDLVQPEVDPYNIYGQCGQRRRSPEGEYGRDATVRALCVGYVICRTLTSWRK